MVMVSSTAVDPDPGARRHLQDPHRGSPDPGQAAKRGRTRSPVCGTSAGDCLSPRSRDPTRPAVVRFSQRSLRLRERPGQAELAPHRRLLSRGRTSLGPMGSASPAGRSTGPPSRHFPDWLNRTSRWIGVRTAWRQRCAGRAAVRDVDGHDPRRSWTDCDMPSPARVRFGPSSPSPPHLIAMGEGILTRPPGLAPWE